MIIFNCVLNTLRGDIYEELDCILNASFSCFKSAKFCSLFIFFFSIINNGFWMIIVYPLPYLLTKHLFGF